MDDDRISGRVDDDGFPKGDDSRPGPEPFVKPGKIVVFEKPNWMLYMYLQMLQGILPANPHYSVESSRLFQRKNTGLDNLFTLLSKMYFLLFQGFEVLLTVLVRKYQCF